MENTETNMLGSAKISKLIRKFSIPSVLSLVISALYNLVDQIFIGHKASLGADGNAATGIVYGLTVIALGIGLMIGDGCGSLMALNQGKGETSKTSKNVGTAVSVSFLAGILIGVICLCTKDPLLAAIGGSGNVLTLASEYATYVFIGFVFYIMGSALNPVIRADGSPVYAMIAMSAGAIVNIILDPVMLYAMDMGMDGAALATLIGQVVTFALSVGYFFKSKTFRLKLKDFIPSKDILAISKLGLSSFLTQFSIFLITLVNNILLVQISEKSGYSIAITQGAITLVFKVFGIIVSIAVGIVAGGAPVIGYNFGAKKFERVKEAIKIIMIAVLITGVIATVLFEACPNLFLYIFGDGGDGVDKQAYALFVNKTFRIYLSFILATLIIKVTAIMFQAMGSPAKATIITTFRDVVFLIPAAILLGLLGGIDAFLWSAPIADFLGLVLALIFFIPAYIKMAKKKDVEGEEIEVSKTDTFDIKESTSGYIITIAREHGTCGKAIGKMVAEMMGVPYYDKELIALAAQESGLDKEYITNIGENSKTSMHDVYLSKNVVGNAIAAQKQVITEIAEKGACVIVGRASDYVLRDNPNLISVFIYANDDYKIKTISERYNDSKEEAYKQIKRSDAARANYYKTVSGLSWSDVHNYDLCLDSSIGTELTAKAIVAFVNRKSE